MHLSKLGLKIIEEANNLKRTKTALSEDLNISKHTLEKVIVGKCKPSEAKNVVTKMLKKYPIDASKLQVVDEEKKYPYLANNTN